MECEIKTSWDGHPLKDEYIHIQLAIMDSGLKVKIQAPFYGDPANPGGDIGEPFDELWNYEVVEIFFLNAEDRYLEVECCPYGQHLVLLLNGQRNPVQQKLPLTYSSTIFKDQKMWKGVVDIPWTYFPQKVAKYNAFAIHGSGAHRQYQALFPVPNAKYAAPDFHRLEYFENLPKVFQQQIWKKIESTSSTMWKH